MTEEQVQPAEAEDAGTAPAADETSEAQVTPAEPVEQTIPKSRFDEVYGKWRSTERDLEYWREQALKGRPEPVKEEKAPELPTPEQHGFDDAKYQAALIDYNKQVARSEAIAALRAEREQEKQQQKIQSFRQREAEFAAKNPDYRDKVYSQSVPISAPMAELIAESEDGPALAFYLAENLDLAAQIYHLPPVQAAREIGRIEARLAQAKVAPPKPALTSAPPPPPKITTSEATTVSIRPTDPESDKEMDDRKWMRERNKQLNRKNR